MTQKIPNIQADAIINIKGKNLDSVSPSLSKKGDPGATIVWKIHPPNHKANIRISLKPGSPNPFTDWPNGYAEGNDIITGTIDSSLVSVGHYLEFEYSVIDQNNNTEIDPGGLVYR